MRPGAAVVSSGGPVLLSLIQVYSTGVQPVLPLSRPRSLCTCPILSPQEGLVTWPSMPSFPPSWLGTDPFVSATCPVSCVLVPRPLTSLTDSCSLAPLNSHSLRPKACSPNVKRLVSLLGRRDCSHKAWLSLHLSSGTSGPQSSHQLVFSKALREQLRDGTHTLAHPRVGFRHKR